MGMRLTKSERDAGHINASRHVAHELREIAIDQALDEEELRAMMEHVFGDDGSPWTDPQIGDDFDEGEFEPIDWGEGQLAMLAH